MQMDESIDRERFVIATYYCGAKSTTNMMKFAAALAVEQTTGTWLQVPGETPEVRERCIGRVVGVYEAPAYQIEVPKSVDCLLYTSLHPSTPRRSPKAPRRSTT